MRGGAAAGAGIVTHIRLSLIDESLQTRWCSVALDEAQLQMCIEQKAFPTAKRLPEEISVSFRFSFDKGDLEPVCSFNVASILPTNDTIQHLNQVFNPGVASVLCSRSVWNEGSLLELRLIPASDDLASYPRKLSDLSSNLLHEDPLAYWKPNYSWREMARSFLASVSHRVLPECEEMLLDLLQAFCRSPLSVRGQIYAIVTLGGGRMLELQHGCSMPLCLELARFEVHWDDPEEEERCVQLTNDVANLILTKKDAGPERPYRGDIWLEEQAQDSLLDEILALYDQR